MDVGDVPTALSGQLGAEATGGLVELFNRAQREWNEQVLNLAAERFERRLVEETSKLRVEMARGFAEVRQEMAGLRADLRQEIAGVRVELREDNAAQGATLRQEMAAQRVDLIKWMFVFWIGQVGVMAALLAFALRGLGR